MFFNLSSIKRRFLKPTSFFGIKLWVAILTCIVLFVLVFVLCITLCIIITRRRCKARNILKPMVSKDLHTNSHNSYSMSRRLLPHNGREIETPEKQVIFSNNQANFDARPSYQFTLTEIETETDSFADENVVACGDYAVVYYGIMFGNTRVCSKAVAQGKAKEFSGEVEVLLGLRHKNLVKLLGYCFEGYYSYLAPEYLSTKLLDDKTDVYSFGILIMEIVSGNPSIEYIITEIEEYLIDWMKSMVASKQFDEIVDPKLPEMPCMKELKRVLLIALKCVDPDVNIRPKMGKVINMLQPSDLLRIDFYGEEEWRCAVTDGFEEREKKELVFNDDMERPCTRSQVKFMENEAMEALEENHWRAFKLWKITWRKSSRAQESKAQSLLLKEVQIFDMWLQLQAW
ncbi:hypothetical protein RND71_018273 [Anisodus tanguticus]|uniref:non-specific serine/threonine protein kinase n=1 Tax=Anisodus tanguticus TaxID=243964 RepID=A0AAE1S5A9_9SOLA|nr:hypothetical protein RND71_018273 [Anisodus tanguticus]